MHGGSNGDPLAGPWVLFNGPLPFDYNGTDNIYIGGPHTQTIDWDPPGETDYPTCNGYLYITCMLTVTGPLGTIRFISSYGGTLGGGWFTPKRIDGILQEGSNTLTVTLGPDTGIYGIGDVRIRTYFL
jgi:hypothetical protein